MNATENPRRGSRGAIAEPRSVASAACATTLLSILVLLGLPANGSAQDYAWVTNNGEITITGYTGSGGDVTIPETINGLPVTVLGSYAFRELTNVTSVTIPDSVRCIEVETFTCCTGLTHIAFGNSVTNIGELAFFRCTGLTQVTIPDLVTELEPSVFHSCTGLTSVTIPDSVVCIKNDAFAYCTGLTNVTLGHGVTEIWFQAFAGCTSLTTFTIPQNLTSIDNGLFRDCTSLRAIFVDEFNPVFGSQDGVLFDKHQTTLLCCPGARLGSYLVPNSVTSIGAWAFSGCTNLNSVSIPDTVLSLGEAAFESCLNLTSVKIGNGIAKIYWCTFSRCASLSELVIPDSVTSIEACAFEYCASLTNLTLGSGVTRLSLSSFVGCTNLSVVTVDGVNPAFSSAEGVLFDKSQTALIMCPDGKTGSYTVPENVTRIESEAFADCCRLTNVVLASTVTNLGAQAFAHCVNLATISVAALSPVYSSAAGVLFDKGQTTLLLCPEGRAGEYAIPDGTTGIGSGAFYSCTNLSRVTFPDSVVSLGSEAFRDCSGLTDLSVPDNVTAIGQRAFQACSRLTNVTLGNGLTRIPDAAFYNCRSLAQVTLPADLTFVGKSAFDSCTRLTRITLPDGVSSIGVGAFYQCISLTNIVIPTNVTTIRDSTFSYCLSLASITIPNGISSIGDQAFYGCRSLTSVTIPSSVTSLGMAVFTYCDVLTAITVDPSNPSYSSLDGVLFDKNLTRLIQFPSGSGGGYSIPHGVITIGAAAFYGCRNLTEVKLGSQVASLEDMAFARCSSLRGVFFRSDAFSVGTSVFSDSDGLTIYHLPRMTGWGPIFAGHPTAVWLPRVVTDDGCLGMRNQEFGFDIAWASGQSVVIDACTSLDGGTWAPCRTNTLTSDEVYFSDSTWPNHPQRFYRLRVP